MDDLLDLDFSKPSHSKPTSNPQANYGAGRSAFDYLAQQQHNPRSSPNPSSLAAASKPSLHPSQPISTRNVHANASRNPNDKADDAFAALFGTSQPATGSAGGMNGGAGLSMAERLARDNASRLGGGAAQGGSAFGSANSAGGNISRSHSLKSPTSTAKPPDPWDFDLLNSSVPSSKPVAAAEPPNDDPFNLGFGTLAPTTSTSTAVAALAPAAQDEFDLLGAFSQPPSSSQLSSTPASPALHSTAPSPSLRPSSAAPHRSASSSPPPHILGQLVEMGFPPLQARNALSATSNGAGGRWNVEAALEVLVDQQKAEETQRRKAREEDEWGEQGDVRVGRRRSWERDDADDGVDAAREAERRRRAAAKAKAREGQPDGAASSATRDAAAKDQAKVLQDQAAEVLAQAQKLGFSMFKSANAYWGAGKEALQKKLEEQRAAARGVAGGGAAENGGRPKWWREGMDLEEEAVEERGAKGKGRAPATGFKDSDDEAEAPESVLPIRSTRGPQQQQPQSAAPPSTSEYHADLLSGAPAPSFAPPSRASASSASPSHPSTRPSRVTPSAASRPSRPSIPVAQSALSSALTHKSTGNAHFKLGRFGEASASYSLALEGLPAGWLGRVPLLNNRAQARLREGEEKKAAEDCAEAVEILLLPSEGRVDLPALEAESHSLPPEVRQIGGDVLDLKDQLGKALARRARACEAVEKWERALEDWERVRKEGDEIVVKGAGGARMVGDGVERCRKMLGGGSRSPSTATARPKPTPAPAAARPRPAPAPVQGSGEAVRALQASLAASLAEDDLRLSLKDAVDAKIFAWKGGKEANLRALIASLDRVLWPELGWKGVGMHELVSEGQVKGRYVRAIAKVHPDKLNANNTTVEQRMIAGLVFAALNDAWNSMKS
ncbi:SPOSA6832_00774 [Sporobolomyces salmonicolor]|uniref:SPOSA6832_00774-mRNA-1:cds n=1 Tax=Sporidiobolus salmonicolor TaxID=5005 RepID=A0A0D6EH39_SPOSA|nr:SPOSA6832_00774 [Sporobolomyces salmonicolor]